MFGLKKRRIKLVETRIEAQGLVEYALVLLLVATVVVTSLQSVGITVIGLLNQAAGMFP